MNRPLDLTRIGRIKVSSISPAVLLAQMEIVEPVKSWLKRLLGITRSAQSADRAPSSYTTCPDETRPKYKSDLTWSPNTTMGLSLRLNLNRALRECEIRA